jgi:hypothetical protein
MTPGRGRADAKEPDGRPLRRLLRASTERPRNRSTAEQRDEPASRHVEQGTRSLPRRPPACRIAASEARRRAVCRTFNLAVGGSAGPWGGPESF